MHSNQQQIGYLRQLNFKVFLNIDIYCIEYSIIQYFINMTDVIYDLKIVEIISQDISMA